MSGPAFGKDPIPDPMKSSHDPQDPDGPVPFFGTWTALYAAVVVSALVVMGLVALFSRWPY